MAGRRWLDPKVQQERNERILRMRNEQGLNASQIAPQVGLSPGGVGRILREAKKEAQNAF